MSIKESFKANPDFGRDTTSAELSMVLFYKSIPFYALELEQPSASPRDCSSFFQKALGLVKPPVTL